METARKKQKYKKDNIFLRGQTFYLDVTIDGKRYKQSLGVSGPDIARKIAVKFINDVNLAANGLPTSTSGKYVFWEVWDKYIEIQEPNRTTDLKKVCSHYFLIVFKDKTINTINRKDIIDYQKAHKRQIISLEKNTGKRESEISFRMINAEITRLSHFFNYARENNYIDINPAEKIKKTQRAEPNAYIVHVGNQFIN